MKKVVKHMRIVLIKDVPRLGRAGEIKVVRPGYARNFLIPQKLAVLPTAPEAKEIFKEKLTKKKEISQEQEKITQTISKLEGKKIVFKVKVNQKDKPFKAIQPQEIAKKINIPEELIQTKPLQEIGVHQILVKKGALQAKVEVVIRPEK